jgi:hypothetical protein
MFGNWVQKINSKLTYVLVIGMLLTAGTLSANALLQTPGIDIGPNYTQQAEAGQNIVYSHILTNTGTTTDTFLLQVFSAHNWPVELIREVYPTGTLELPLNVGPQMTASFQVSLTVPPGIAGVTDVTIITATSQLSPTVHKTATDTTIVLSRIFLPVIMNRWPPIPDTPVLNPISNPNGGGDYSVTWSAANRANTYTLQETTTPAFTNPTVQYSGTETSWGGTSKSTGTYYYRVKATNSWGDSAWSNIVSVNVEVYDGTWHGTTSQGKDIWFGVRGNAVGSLNVYYVINGCQITADWYWTDLVPIVGNKFTKTMSGAGYSIVVQGTFTSDTNASGTIQATEVSCGGSINITWSATKVGLSLKWVDTPEHPGSRVHRR